MGRAAVENLALRQQVAVLKESVKRPKLRPRDRAFWAWLMRVWPHWKSALIIVKPDTVDRWHRQGYKLSCRWKSRTRRAGRSPFETEVRALIQRMSTENPTFLDNRIHDLMGIYFFTVPRAMSGRDICWASNGGNPCFSILTEEYWWHLLPLFRLATRDETMGLLVQLMA